MSTEPTILISGTDPDLPPTVLPGLRRYTGFREMARGGSGLLRSCFDPITGRTVAVKSLLPENRKDGGERRRLLREARVTAQLQHPNTPPVYDIGDDDIEGIFIVMKRISGENLFEVLKRIARGDEATAMAFPLARRIEILEGTCQALAYSHARGVIHRDVKPENIWVGNFGEVVLLDWGTAKVWGHADDNIPIRQSVLQPRVDPDHDHDAEIRMTTLTGGGQRPGTPLYMSPEQVDGNRGIDERTDVFSVGVCLYEMMALREPFRGATIDETFDNIRHREVMPPSERAPERQIPAAIDAIVMKCIAKRPGQRYQSMRDLIADLKDAQHAC